MEVENAVVAEIVVDGSKEEGLRDITREYTPDEQATITRLKSLKSTLADDEAWLGSAVGELDHLRADNAKLHREIAHLRQQKDWLERRVGDLELRLRGVPVIEEVA